MRERLGRFRAAALTVLGARCAHCGLTDRTVLQIDHVHGGGNQERKKLQKIAFYQQVIAQAETGKYQLLCANCNWRKGGSSR